MSVASADQDETQTLTGLREMIAGGGQALDLILDRVAGAAWRLTGASGAAVAMWKDGEVACRARAGEAAPALGARLSADSGISGACLKSGTLQQCDDTENDPRVDAEVCRDLGLRSIVALPIQAWREVNGILEVFSTKDHAFTEQHVAVLQRLAVMAEWARASEPRATSPFKKPVAVGPPAADTKTSQEIGSLAAGLLANHGRAVTWGGVTVLGFVLIGFVIWLGWRGPSQPVSHTTGVPQPVVTNTQPSSASDPFANPVPIDQTRPGKTSAGIPVKLASKVDRVPDVTRPSQHALSQSSDANNSAPGIAVQPETKPQAKVEIAEIQPPMVVPDAGASSLTGVLSSTATTPVLIPPPISHVANGYLTHKVEPKYPPQALQMRLSGKVVLEAAIQEDGSVNDLKVLQGDSTLARAALDAVLQWRYKPYELNGKPVKMKTKITLDFRIP